MIKAGRFSSGGHHGRNHCQPGELCPRCLLFKVIRLRFSAFREKFGRDPKPDEPIFFDPDRDRPVQVGLGQAIHQIAAAAQELRIKIRPILELLRVDADAYGNFDPALTVIAAQKYPFNEGLAQAGKLSPGAVGRGAAKAHPKQSLRPELSVVRGRGTAKLSRRKSAATSARTWREFVHDELTHRRHKISDDEWRTLSQVALMGDMLSARDLLFILKMIRHAGGL